MEGLATSSWHWRALAGLLATRGSKGLLEVANPIALALDESLQGPGLEGLIRSGFISGFVLKPMALGLLQSRALAARAAEYGLWTTVTHLFDGPLAMELALDLARALIADGVELRACGLDDHPGLVALRAVAE